MEIDPYAILLHGVKLTIYPQEDGGYKVYKGSNLLADLYPEVTESGTTWETSDWIDQDYVEQIGELIHDHEELLNHQFIN